MNGGLILKRVLAFVAVLTVVLLGAADSAWAVVAPGGGGCGGGGIGGVICNVVLNSAETPGLLSGLSYLTGLIMGIWAIYKLIEHVQNPAQVSGWEPLKRAIIAGAMFALPIVIEAVYITLTDGDDTGITDSGWSGAPTGGGLDAMVVALMNDIFEPMTGLIPAFCYLAGVILVMIGIMRLLKSSQEGPRGPGGFGTIMTFLIAGALFAVDEMMASWSISMFGTEDITTNAALNFDAGLTALEEQHILSVISAVVAFVMVLGWISFVRGFFIIRDVAEGNSQASLMSGMTHLFGGALAINLGPVLNAVQETFGLAAIGVPFG